MGRKPNDIKIQLMGTCLNAGLTTREAAKILGCPLSTAKIYAWAHRNPRAHRQWCERQRREARERYEKTPRSYTRSTYWTDERLARLKEMRDEGRSFSWCAEKLGGGCTRNMVAGAVNRRGAAYASPLFPPLSENFGGKRVTTT